MKNLVTVLVLILGFSAQAQIHNLNLDLRNIVIGIGGEKSGSNVGATLSVINAGGIGGEVSFGANGDNAGYLGALVSYDLFKSKNLPKFLKKGKFNVNVGAGILVNQVYETEEIRSKTSFRYQTPAQLIGSTYKLQAKVGVRFKMLQASIGIGSQGLNVGFGFILKRNKR